MAMTLRTDSAVEAALARLAERQGVSKHEAAMRAILRDDAEAKAVAARFLDELGYDAVDIGGLDESWRVERDTPAYGARATADELRALVAKAVRVQQV